MNGKTCKINANIVIPRCRIEFNKNKSNEPEECTRENDSDSGLKVNIAKSGVPITPGM